MLLTDFIDAIKVITLLRLKMNEWDASTLISDNMSKIELGFNEGYAPVECLSEILGRELPEYFGDPGYDPTKKYVGVGTGTPDTLKASGLII